MISPKSFLYELDAATGVATLTLNRPDRLNALTFEVYRELAATFGALDTEPGVRAIIITGKGRAFCTGGDVEDIIGALLGKPIEDLLAFTRRSPANSFSPSATAAGRWSPRSTARWPERARSSPRPATSGSRRPTAKIAFLFTKVGLSGADMGAAWLLPRLVGEGRADGAAAARRFHRRRGRGASSACTPACSARAGRGGGPGPGRKTGEGAVVRDRRHQAGAQPRGGARPRTRPRQRGRAPGDLHAGARTSREAYRGLPREARAEIRMSVDLNPSGRFSSRTTASGRAEAFGRGVLASRRRLDDAEGRAAARGAAEAHGRGRPFRGAIRHASLTCARCCLLREELAVRTRRSPTRSSPFRPWARCRSCSRGRLSTLAARQALAGEAMGAFAMTEPEAGSDVDGIATRRGATAIRLRPRRRQDPHLERRDRRLLCVFAATDRAKGRRGHRLLRGSGRRRRGSLRRGPGDVRAASAGRDRLRDCRVPASARLGKEGEGFKLGSRTLDRLRATVAAAACGMAARALDEAIGTRATRAVSSVEPLADLQLDPGRRSRAWPPTSRPPACSSTGRRWELDHGAERVDPGVGDGEALRDRGRAAHRRRRGADPRRPRRPAALARSTGSTALCARCASTRGPRRSSTSSSRAKS